MKKWLLRLLSVLLLAVLGAFAAIWLSPVASTAFAIDLERRASGLEHQQLTLPDGTRYHYLIGGQGEPLLLLHGFGANKDNFTRIARQLTPHYRVIVPDHVGFGESSRPQPADYRATAQAERLHQFIQQLPNENIQKLHLGGSSMGGHIALAYAARYPEQVQSLWLLDPGGVWSAPKAEAFEIKEKTGMFPLLVSSVEDYRRVYELAMSQPPYVPAPMLAVMAQPSIDNRKLEADIFEQISNDS
ncbi:MAG: alpha/beta hydrolase, partial [Pseudomonadota bacterium]|nr:alpha/beta hydrolase [Pseudomonadota bacterium]